LNFLSLSRKVYKGDFFFNLMRCLIKKRGQIWVETVIYTLIGLTIIGLVLAVALPKINAKKDQIMIDQSIQALTNVDDKIYEVQRAVGNRRTVDLKVGKGKFIIDMDEDKIRWVLNSRFKYSEPGMAVPLGNMEVTTKAADPWEVTLELSYSVDLQFDQKVDGIKELDAAPAPYKLIIDNKPKDGDKLIIELRVS